MMHGRKTSKHHLRNINFI